MRFTALAVAAIIATTPAFGQTTPAAAPEAQQLAGTPLTLLEAIRLAESANPVLRSRQAQLAAAEGTARDASSLLQYNPQLTAQNTRRKDLPGGGSSTFNEPSVGLTQTIEIAGQPGHRREAARTALDALRLEIEDLRIQQRAELAKRFYRVLALQRRVEIEAQAAKLFDDTARAVERRRSAGEDTRLDANVALVEAERARNQLASVQEQLIEARSALATPLLLPPTQLLEVSGTLDPSALDYTEQALLDSARAQPRLQGLAARQTSAAARLRLEQALRTPDVTVGLSAGREGPPGSRERLTTLSVAIPLPLFKRNASGIGAATSESTLATVEREAAERDIPTQVHALWQRVQSLRQRLERLQGAVLPALNRNEELSTRSLRAGQISLLELIVTNRQVLDARRDLLDALLDYQTTRLTLEATAGWKSQN